MRGALPFGFECRKEHRDLPTPRSANWHGRRQSRQPDHFVKFQGGKSEVPSKATVHSNAPGQLPHLDSWPLHAESALSSRPMHRHPVRSP